MSLLYVSQSLDVIFSSHTEKPMLEKVGHPAVMLKAMTVRAMTLVTTVAAVFTLSACQSLPSQPHSLPTQPHSLPDSFITIKNTVTTDKNSAPTNATQNVTQPAPSQSSYYPLVTNQQAANARYGLTHLARQRIDVQYYIWHNDEAGQRLLNDLYAAANRGVMVRLLLDDLNTNAALDQQLLAFAQHPNIQVRLMNPKAYRKLFALNFVTSLPRIQRRMHNKSMTFDGQMSIIGGRNIGNEYLRNDQPTQFSDLDVLVAGNVITDIQSSFEEFWQSNTAFDIQTLVKPSHTLKNLPADRRFLQTLDKLPQATSVPATQNPSQISEFEMALATQTLPLRPAQIRFISDKPDKLTTTGDTHQHLLYRLRDMVGEPKRQFTIISSYFVPSPDGIRQLQTLAKQGVKIKILTNSFAATDVAAVHAGYSQARVPLLAAGIELYELKPSAQAFNSLVLDIDKPKRRLSERLKTGINNRLVSPFSPNIRAQYAVRHAARIAKRQARHLSTASPITMPTVPTDTPLSASQQLSLKNATNSLHRQNKKPTLAHFHSTTSLHTKAFAVDEDKVFIGSYNIDPRSANINTELGVLINDPQLAQQLHQSVNAGILSQAYQVMLNNPLPPSFPDLTDNSNSKSNRNARYANALVWKTINSRVQPPIRLSYTSEPKISWLNKSWLWLFGKLPIVRYL